MKRLRSALNSSGFDCNVRFFACGEYGSAFRTWRPHFHILLFSMPDLMAAGDLSPSDVVTSPDSKHFFSGIIGKCWTYGRHDVGEVTWESTSYVARYCLKKLEKCLGDDPPSFESDPVLRRARSDSSLPSDRSAAADLIQKYKAAKPFFRPKEFIIMSRRPGIGAFYFQQHKDQFDLLDGFVFKFANRVETVHSIAYFDRLFDLPNRSGSAEKTKYSAVLRRRKVKRSMLAQSCAELLMRGDRAPREERAAADERRSLSYLKNKVQYLDNI